ncbi:MAG: hypothetical protein JXB85_00045 [Anaerolineales bacterium]|nr:hypothetical protein [Anaerolineales bacterium]
MHSKEKPRQFLRLSQREAAERHLFLTLLSFAASITLTRLFLSLTNYPQLGSGELHLAHVLWGGLLLYVAALLPLLFANRGIFTLSALLAGTGVGLFIDEVGKFITQQNDYFFPVAAAIIYVVFLLTLLLFLHIRRRTHTQERDGLARIFEDLWEALHHPSAPREQASLKTRLENAKAAAPSPQHAGLAGVLAEFLEAQGALPPDAAEQAQPALQPARRIAARMFSQPCLRVSLILGLTAIGLLTLKNPASVLLASWLPTKIIDLLASLYAGRQVDAASAPLWFAIRLGLEVVVGVLLLVSAGFLVAKRDRLATSLGSVALLLSLTTVNILLFYFEQFSTIITTSIQFLLLIGINAVRRRSE